MNVTDPKGMKAGLSVALGIAVFALIAIRIISFIERRAKNREPEPLVLKKFPPLEGRWENDRGYIVFRKEDRFFGKVFVSNSMERVVDAAKQMTLVTGGDSNARLNKFVNDQLVFVEQVGWKYDYETLIYRDAQGRESIYRRKEGAQVVPLDWYNLEGAKQDEPKEEKAEARPIDPAWNEASMIPAYLSDLPEIEPRVGYGKFGKNGQLGYGIGGEQNSLITVGGRTFPKAISLAPPHSGYSTVRYSLEGNAKIFRAWVAVNDLIDANRKGPTTPLQFMVLGNGRLLWKSEKVSLAGVATECRINVQGIESLELRVECPGLMDCARAVWLEPRILK